MKKHVQAAQGDLLIEMVTATEARAHLAGATPIEPDRDGRIVLAKSEVKGHEHCFIDPRVIAWELPTETRQMLIEVKAASPENPVLLLGGSREAQRARLNGAPVTDTVLPGEGHFPIPIVEPGFYHIPQQVERDLLGDLRQVVD